MNEALTLHQNGPLAAAQRLYESVIQQSPENADAHHFPGVIAHQSQYHLGAVALIDKAIALFPGDPAAHANRALALKALGDFPGSVAVGDALVADRGIQIAGEGVTEFRLAVVQFGHARDWSEVAQRGSDGGFLDAALGRILAGFFKPSGEGQIRCGCWCRHGGDGCERCRRHRLGPGRRFRAALAGGQHPGQKRRHTDAPCDHTIKLTAILKLDVLFLGRSGGADKARVGVALGCAFG